MQTNIFKQLKHTLLVFSLIILATTLNIAQNKSLPTLRGTEAVESLKENGQYDSLIEAVKAAREKDGQPSETPTDDAVGQSAKLVASDGTAAEYFGGSVAVSGDTAIIGSYQNTVGGNIQQGSAYIFVRSGTVWTEQAQLTAPDGASGDLFGYSVAISGETVIVGSLFDTVGANNSQGSAYVFTRSGAIWTLQQKLTASDGALGDSFGTSVAIVGEIVIIGAFRDAVGANSQQGSAYIFVRSGTVWTEQQKLIASDGAAGDQFGFSVAIFGETVIVSAYEDDIGANSNQGSAYIFTRSGTTWSEQQKLIASDGAANDRLGRSVAISGETVIIGSLFDTVGANNSQGSAYVFTRSGAIWTLQQKLTAADGAANDNFGISVAIFGDTVIVGANGDDVGAVPNQGSAYIFARSGTAWTQQTQLTAADAQGSEFFGNSVAVFGNTIIVGVQGDRIGTNNNQGSAYVFRNLSGNWTQEAQKVASDGAAGDFFGTSVAISGDTAVVGSYRDNAFQGSAYIFVRSGTAWTQQQKLTASDAAVNDSFGSSVAISGETVIVGANGDDVGANINQGSAYIFVRSGTTWTEQQKLTASDGAADEEFGASVAISGETAVVGNVFDTIGANAGQGSAHVFVRSGTTWTQQQKLTASDGAANDQFGLSVSISGNSVIVGSQFDDVGANTNQGSAYIFVRSGTVWTEQQKLTASDGAANDNFGLGVAISDDTAIIGARTDDVGANTDQGAAYVFIRTGTVWTEQQKLTASDGAANDNFGFSVAVSGDTAIVGSRFDDVGANTDQGSAYVFTRTGTNWAQTQKLTATGGTAGDRFGNSVAVSGDKIIVGAPFSDASVSTPLNSAGKNELVPQAADQGAVFVFVNSPLAPTAANVSIGGRVFTPEGAGLRNAIVYLTKPDGTTVSTRSTSFGYYRFETLEAGEIYTIAVNSKLYSFAPQVVQANESLSDVDFTAFE